MAYKAREIIQKEYGSSKNFMTPHVISYGKINKNVAYELSSGEGLERGSKMYGVSVASINKSGKTRRLEKSKSFHDKNEAESYIRNLKKTMSVKNFS